MKETNLPAASRRKRKMLLVLPALVIPFITLAFWSMGGGKGEEDSTASVFIAEGLNTELPAASFKGDKGMNKLGYYEKADRDSARREELLRNDPFHKTAVTGMSDTAAVISDSNEVKVYAKIAALDMAMNEKNAIDSEPPFEPGKTLPDNSSEVDRLEQMMETMQKRSSAGDPEMDQLSGMLDKIMDIQHPERVTEQARKSSLKQADKVFPVTVNQPKQNISLLVSEKESRSGLTVTDTAFYSLEDMDIADAPNTIEAVIHETRTLVNGAVVKLRLLNDIYIAGTLVPKGNFVYGKAVLNGERLNIEVNSVRYKNSLYPVSLMVYDMDGMDGVFIPGAITRDVAKESSDRAIQGIALGSLDPSIGSQAASAGIEAAKSLLTKKIKLVRVMVKAGYRVLLKDKK